MISCQRCYSSPTSEGITLVTVRAVIVMVLPLPLPLPLPFLAGATPLETSDESMRDASHSSIVIALFISIVPEAKPYVEDTAYITPSSSVSVP